MKEVKKIAEGKNFSAVDFGKLNELGGYVLSLGDIKIPGKVFGGQALGTKGAEFSFQIYQPGQEGGFYHTHKTHEELYFVLSGKGEYNNGTEPMVVLCVQYRETAFTQDDATDGVILKDQVKW